MALDERRLIEQWYRAHRDVLSLSPRGWRNAVASLRQWLIENAPPRGWRSLDKLVAEIESGSPEQGEKD